MNSPPPKTRYEKLIDRVKDHPLLSFLLVCGTVLIGIGQFSDALDKVSTGINKVFLSAKSKSPDSERIKLHRNSEVLSVETSNVSQETSDSKALTVKAEILNHADYYLEYPHVELTILDLKDRPLARWIFRPEEYLQSGALLTGGMPPKATIPIALTVKAVETKDKLDSYRLYIFYP